MRKLLKKFIRLKRTCGRCRHSVKTCEGFCCGIFGYKIFERNNAVGCKYFGKYKKNRYPIE